MGEVAESEGVCAQCFEASVAGFAGSIGGVAVEEGEDVIASAPQGAAELGDLLQSGRHAAADRGRSTRSLRACCGAGWRRRLALR